MRRHQPFFEDTSGGDAAGTSASTAEVPPRRDAKGSAAEAALDTSTIAQYFHDVRRFPLLSHEREIALARDIQEGGQQWRELFLQRLLHVPLLLACRARLRRGSMPISAICLPDHAPTLLELIALLDQLQRLRCQMRQLMHSPKHPCDPQKLQRAALRAEMQALLASLVWQPTFLQHAWSRLDMAMAAASPVRQGRQAARYLSTLGYTLSTLRALWRTLHRLHTRVERAKQEMITRNLRLVISVAREFSHTGMPLTDLIQEGNIGLMRAVDKFDYRRNLKFSTYAVWWIKQAMRRAMFEQSMLIRVPEYMHESARQVHRHFPLLAAELGRPPTAMEMAQRLAMPVERVERSLALVAEPISLDQPLAETDRRTLGDSLADTQASPSQETLVQQDLIDQTRRALAGLDPREAEVIRRRFGLHGQPGETLRQIGLGLHLSHERVRQIEAEALAKLKQQGATLRVFLEP